MGLSLSVNAFTFQFMPNFEKTLSVKFTIPHLLDIPVVTKLQNSLHTIIGGLKFSTIFENTSKDVKLVSESRHIAPCLLLCYILMKLCHDLGRSSCLISLDCCQCQMDTTLFSLLLINSPSMSSSKPHM